MHWGDTTRLGRPYAKDPSVVRMGDRYLLYYSLPAFADKRPNNGWAIGIAASRNMIDWEKLGEMLPAGEHEAKGLCAPNVILLDGKVHMFYQTYGNGPKDAICHAVSTDGISFERDPSNPVFSPSGAWTCGRAIDAEIIVHRNKLMLFAATRDPGYKTQMVVAAAADLKSGFGKGSFKQLLDGPILKPELPWEKMCIEAPAVVKRGEKLYMFYAGGYNNEPQQIGCAVSEDGVRWKRISDEPFLPNGKDGEWNSSESGHPGAFVDRDGQTYLFYQGNNDKGKTWYLSFVKIGWSEDGPYVMPS
jgi:predicted GH43/DUF377 family glycosyl hydrolase